MNNFGKIVLITIIIMVLLFSVWFIISRFKSKEDIYTYEESNEKFLNPLIGFAHPATYKAAVGKNNLVYIAVLWSDFEPQEGVFDFGLIEEKNNLKLWREQGKHAVLRFICDMPGKEPHIDIPDWLHEKTGGDGIEYNKDGHAGFSPNYSNTVFIEYHKKAVQRLGEYFSEDTFVSYVQLGSLGHYGEWHVFYSGEENPMPPANIRQLYVEPYVDYFKNAKMLMRRPFAPAQKYGFGLYDDMAGHKEATVQWLGWIQNGGDYNGEKNAISAMPDFWKTAPVGGEFNSALSFDWMLRFHTQQTIDLLIKSHTSFLGPKAPHGLTEDSGENCEEGVSEVLKTIGYRIWISEIGISSAKSSKKIIMKWENSGIAPIYWDWPVYLYLVGDNNEVISKKEVEIKLSQLLPGQKMTSQTTINLNDELVKKLYIGIEDPMTGKAAVNMAMVAERLDCMSLLLEF